MIYGHTHRTGPLPQDDLGDWRRPGHPALTNCGCWIYEAAFGRRGAQSPYWPGGLVQLADAGPPVLHRVLEEMELTELLV